MSAVVEAIGEVGDAIGGAVGAVGSVVEDVVQDAGHFVEDVGKSVGKTVEAIAQDPAKAIPLIVVAVVAPELAPLLWEGATTMEAAMVLNTGMQIAEGRDPVQIATNLATSAITSGITDGLEISTGNSIVDRSIGQTASRVIQGQDVASALGSTIGGQIIGAGTRGVAGDIRDVTGLSDQPPAPITDYSTPAPTQTAQTEVPDDSASRSQTFQDAIDKGFTPQEAYAIAKGEEDAAASKTYAPTAGVSAEFIPGTTQVLSDTGETTSPLVEEKEEELPDELKGLNFEDIYRMYTNKEISEDEYNQSLKSNVAPLSLQEYKDTGEKPYTEEAAPSTGTLPTPEQPTTPFSGVIGSAQTDDGYTKYTFDDGSTLTVDKNQDVIDFTEATDEYVEPEEGAAPDGKGGIRIGFGRIGKGGAQARSMRQAPARPSTTAAPSGSLEAPGVSLGSGLTPGLTLVSPEYNLFGEIEKEPQQMAEGRQPVDTTGVYDLSYTAASPFAQGKDIMVLKPGLTKPKIDYALPGYPFGQTWKLAATGGSITDDHKPEFYSEGGLNSIKNRYVKGNGDGTSDSIPAMLANGEFVIPADVVSSLGNGDNDSGAKVLDEFLRTIRKHKRNADPKKLPPDSKGALGYLLEAKKRVKK